MAVQYHTHTFDIPVASDAEVAAGVVNNKVVVPSSLGTAAVADSTDFASAASGALAATALQPAAIGTTVQAYNAALTSIAGLTTAADQVIFTTASNLYSTTSLTAFGRSIIGGANAAAIRALLGLGGSAVLNVGATAGTVAAGDDSRIVSAIQSSAIGVSVQAYDADLAAIAGLTSAANKGIQFTGAGTAGTYDLTTAGKALLDDADASAQRTTLGLGGAAVLSVGTTAGTVAAGDDSRIVNAVPNTRTLTNGNGIAAIGDLSTNRSVALLTQLGVTYATATDADLLLGSGRFLGLSGIANAPDASQTYWYEVVGNGASRAKVIATADNNPYRVFIRNFFSGSWGSWVLQNATDIRSYGAVGDGATNAQAAIELACASQTGRVIGTAAFASIPQAPVIELIIPDGVWHVAGLVDTGDKNVTYYVAENATFTSGSVDNLNSAKIVRKNRTTSYFMSGILDSATVRSTMGGDGAADRSPLVNGITNVNQIGTVDTFDAVVDYADFTGVTLTHTSTATFTSSTCTLAVAAPAKRLRVGMTLLTSNNYAAQILSWNAGRTIITVAGWYPLGSTTPGTPAAATVYFNPISEGYVRNTNVFLTSAAYTYQGTAHEMGLINNKVAPASAEDSSGKTWMSDAVWLSGFRGSIGHITRGDWWEGFRAAGTQIGFRAAAYASYGYAAPLVGFEYQGGGIGFRARNAAGTNMVDIDANTGTINTQKLNLFALVNAANDAAAAGAGVPINGTYRNGSVLMTRVV